MRNLSKIQTLSISITFGLGVFLLFVYLFLIRNPLMAIYLPSTYMFLAVTITLFVSSYLIYKSATLHSKDKHLSIHQHRGPIILALFSVGLSLFFLFEAILLGLEGGGIFFTLRFTAVLTICLTTLASAANMAVSTHQSLKTAVLLLKTSLVMSFFLMIQILSSSTPDVVYTVFIIYSLLNLIPEAILLYFADGFEKQIAVS